ncbi:DUF2892 domain-containing protein [Candidatus Woesearchaeota archaeon]|nr:DUF2892 domain-containing protein [Candidatus Woesearchaeota archaeon]
MEKNLGKVDRVLRFALAFWWLGPFAPQYASPFVNWLIFIVGWIALIESFVSFCWLHNAFGIHTKDQ